MRPQFSLLVILIVTGYAAIVAAAAADILSAWTNVAILAVPCFFLVAGKVAVFARGRRRVFACGMVVGSLSFAAYSILPLPPQVWIEQWVPDPPASLHKDFDVGDYGVFITKSIFVMSQLSLAGGVLGGLIATAMWPEAREIGGKERRSSEMNVTTVANASGSRVILARQAQRGTDESLNRE